MLKKWMAAERLYLREMDLEDMAALKVCLLSLGTLLGLGLSRRARKPAALMASFLFVGTYLPLMTKFLCVLTRPGEDKED